MRPLFTNLFLSKKLKITRMSIWDNETLKKLMYMAVGYAALQPEKITDLTDSLLEKGKMTEEEGRKFVAEMTERTESFKQSLDKKIEEISKAVYSTLHLAQTEEVESLRERVKALEEKLAELGQK